MVYNTLSKNKQDCHAITGMSHNEFVKYVDVIGLEAVRTSSE